MAAFLAGCGGGGSSSGGGQKSPTTPTVAVTPASTNLTAVQVLNVTVAVSGTSGTPTGTVTLSSGTYASSATTLSGGSVTISIPSGALAAGNDTLMASYTPDTASSSTYNIASGNATVTVTLAIPTVEVKPFSLSILMAQALQVAVSVSGGPGTPSATGSVALSSGTYTSAATALSSGIANITVPASTFTAGTVTLTASYTPDGSGSALYNSASGVSSAISVYTANTVAVNQSGTGVKISDQLLGMNLAAWFDEAANATAVNTAFEHTGIKAIRWPGCSWSDAYHWGQGGVAPTMCDSSKPGSGATSWAGWDTFPQLVSSIVQPGNYDLALTADYGSNAACTGGGDPAEAAAWAAEAVKEGAPASHITVGNEEYGNWEFDLHAKQHDPATYASAVAGANGYYSLIKAADSAAQVGVVVDADNTPTGWDKTVLANAKGSYDFVEFHFYPQTPGNEDDTYLVHKAAQDLTSNINILKSELSAAGLPNTPIYVGEMGSVYSTPGKQSWSITQGLYAGQTLGEMMNGGVVRATWWIGFGNCDVGSNGTAAGNMSSSLYGWQTFGAYNVFSDGPTDGPCGVGSGAIGTMSPTARAFQLFSNVAVSGEMVLAASVTGITDDVRAYAATHSGGTALLLFNLNQTTSEPVTVTLSQQNASTDVTVITYDKAIYDQTNAKAPVWGDPKTTDIGPQNLPLTLTLTPWSMNVVIIK